MLPSPPLFSPLSLHDALPIFLSLAILPGQAKTRRRTEAPGSWSGRDWPGPRKEAQCQVSHGQTWVLLFSLFQFHFFDPISGVVRSEEHTSELQSRGHLVCRLL